MPSTPAAVTTLAIYIPLLLSDEKYVGFKKQADSGAEIPEAELPDAMGRLVAEVDVGLIENGYATETLKQESLIRHGRSLMWVATMIDARHDSGLADVLLDLGFECDEPRLVDLFLELGIERPPSVPRPLAGVIERPHVQPVVLGDDE